LARAGTASCGGFALYQLPARGRSALGSPPHLDPPLMRIQRRRHDLPRVLPDLQRALPGALDRLFRAGRQSVVLDRLSDIPTRYFTEERVGA
jgi:hypothetical protein